MEYIFLNKDGVGKLRLIENELDFNRYFYGQETGSNLFTLAWNRGGAQQVRIDEMNYLFAADSILPLMNNQSYQFERATDIIAWQFNREFYCLVNHDAEVGCVGFLFFGPTPTMFIALEGEHKEKMQKLLWLFEEEYQNEEDIKSEMLRSLLVRLIIAVTRLAKKQYLSTREVTEDKFNLIRQYNLSVEIHFRKEHQVSFYAGLLNKSPKTIANYFSLYSKKTPLQIIQDRIISEAKRLFYYSDKSVKEIADNLGFEDSAHFSRFFKNHTTHTPSEIRKMMFTSS